MKIVHKDAIKALKLKSYKPYTGNFITADLSKEQINKLESLCIPCVKYDY